MVGREAVATGEALGPFHVHRGHDFEGFQIERRQGRAILLARCGCGAVLDVADAVLAPCPDCDAAGRECARCGDSGQVINHAALLWRLPDEGEGRDADHS